MLEWNVYISNFNSKQIETYNVFDHICLREYLRKDLKKCHGEDRKEQFCELMRKELMYYFWSKCEWEIVLDHWPHRESAKEEKIDVYDQIRLNWEPFCDYVWSHRKEL